MHERRNLLIGSASMVKRLNLPSEGEVVIRIRNEMRACLEENGYFLGAPFDSVSLIFRFGFKDNFEPDGYKINAKQKSLETAVEFNGEALRALTKEGLEQRFREVLIDVLCDVAANFDRPYEFLDSMRRQT